MSPRDLLEQGVAAHKAGRTGEAEALYRRVLAADPDDAGALRRLGVVTYQRGEHEAAAALIRQAIARDPAEPGAYSNLGIVLEALGRLDEAAAAYRQALDRRPGDAGAHHNLAQVKTFTPGDPDLAALEAAAEKAPSLPPGQATPLYFALGKALEDLAEHERAFAAYAEGNRLRRATLDYDPARDARVFRKIQAAFGADLIRRLAAAGDPSREPVFILGMPRSGTTLVEQILASHPKVFGAGELKALGAMTAALGRPDGRALPFPDYVPTLTPAERAKLGQHYLKTARAEAPGIETAGRARFTDKMPLNFPLAGLIHLILPGARIIHCRRDALDTCVSCYTRLFTEANPFTYDLAELGRYYRLYEEIMAHWRAVLPAGRVLEVRYEEVVADTDAQARRIVAHCGLPWDSACLAFHEAKRPVVTASSAQVRRPIFQTSVARWRRFETHLGPLRAALEPSASEDEHGA